MLRANSASKMRGRVMGLHRPAMLGVVPLGTPLEGALGSALGVPLVLPLGGGAVVGRGGQ